MNATVNLIENARRQSFFSDDWLRLRRNKLAMVGLVMILILCFVAIFAPFLAPYDPIKQDLRKSHLPPSQEHPLGTDLHGRDLLSRLIYGTRISLLVGFLPQFVSLFAAIVFMHNVRRPPVITELNRHIESSNRATILSIDALFRALLALAFLPVVGKVADKISVHSALFILCGALVVNQILFSIPKSIPEEAGGNESQ